MNSASQPRIHTRWALVLAALVLLPTLLFGPEPAHAQIQTQEQLLDYIERTVELLEWARDLVLETENQRARTVLQEAKRLHDQSVSLSQQQRPLRAYEMARRAREAVWLSVRLAREAMNYEEQTRVRAERFRDIFEEVRERALEVRHEAAISLLRQSEAQAQRARERYLQGDAKSSLELLEQAEQLLQRARRMLQGAGKPGGLENELERTRRLIERAGERLSERAGDNGTEMLDEAVRSLTRAEGQLAQGRPVQARRSLEVARRLATQAVEGDRGPDEGAIRRQIERWDDRANRLETRMDRTDSDRAQTAYRKAREHRAKADSQLAAGEPRGALRQIRAAHERLDQVERLLR